MNRTTTSWLRSLYSESADIGINPVLLCSDHEASRAPHADGSLSACNLIQSSGSHDPTPVQCTSSQPTGALTACLNLNRLLPALAAAVCLCLQCSRSSMCMSASASIRNMCCCCCLFRFPDRPR